MQVVAGAEVIKRGPHHNIRRQIHIVDDFAIRPVNRLRHVALNHSRRTKSPTIATSDQGGVMKKSLIILALTLLQGACATQEPVHSTTTSLPGFDVIGAEITIRYEQLRGQ